MARAQNALAEVGFVVVEAWIRTGEAGSRGGQLEVGSGVSVEITARGVLRRVQRVTPQPGRYEHQGLDWRFLEGAACVKGLDPQHCDALGYHLEIGVDPDRDVPGTP